MKILVLASGGDSQGMNRVLYRLAKKFRKNLYVCKYGFKGLINNRIEPASNYNFRACKNEAGVVIKSERSLKFATDEGFKKGLKNAKKFDFVIAMGGNGTSKGAQRLAENGVKTIFVPATIDNDVQGTDYTLGFHSAVRACCQAVRNVMPSMISLGRSCVFEVMGRLSPKIAENVAKILQADYVVATENDLDFPKIAKILIKNSKQEKSSMVILRENIMPVEKFVDKLKVLSKDANLHYFVVGRIQRGTKPTKVELKKADQIAKQVFKAVKKPKDFSFVFFDQGDCKIK